MRLNGLFVTAMGFLISALLAGNLYFANRLIEKVDEIEKNTWGLKQELIVLKITLENRLDKLEKQNGKR